MYPTSAENGFPQLREYKRLGVTDTDGYQFRCSDSMRLKEAQHMVDKQKADAVAHELMRNDFMKGEWAEPTLACWLRYECRCAYCGCDMLQSRAGAFHGYSLDHILPKGKYPTLERSEWNMALACSLCNRIKGRWDPNNCGEPLYTGEPLKEEQVQELIGRASDYVKRKDLDPRFQQLQSAIRDALGSLAK